MFNRRIALAMAAFSVVASALTPQAQAVVSYVVPAGTDGNQGFGGALGMDFNVNTPITIDQLGVFDDDSNGLSAPITAYIYNRAAGNTAVPVATLVFPAGSPGTLIGGSRFLDLAVPIELPAGFQGTIVASGYTAAEENGNQGVASLGLTTNSGGGAISFVGGSRFGVTPTLFPATGDAGPANRYASGTFNFDGGSSIAVPLQNATAIHSQDNSPPVNPDFSVRFAIDGLISPSAANGGWANSALGDNTAVFETVTDLENINGSRLQFNIASGGFGNHTLGRFRISVTGDDRSTFADGLENGGDVTADWTVLNIDSIMSTNPTTTFTELADLSILAGGGVADVETYLLSADTELSRITGIRIEMLEDASLPAGGPGRAGNGNYVLLEFGVTAQARIVPEPASALLLGLGAIGLLGRRRRMA